MTPPTPGDAALSMPPWLGDVLVGASALLLGALAAWAARGARMCAQAVREAGRGEAALVAACVVAGGVVRALVPHRLVMAFFGYDLVQSATSLATIPRYGAGAAVLWHALFHFVAPDHAAVQWLHAALGTASIALVAAVARTLAPRPGVAAFAAFAYALSPVFIRDSVSESILVPAMTWTLCACVAAAGWARGRDFDLAGVVAGLGLVALTRSDATPGALSLVVLTASTAAGGVRVLVTRARTLAFAGATVVLAAVLVPAALHARAAAAIDVAAGNLPWLGERPLLSRLPEWLARRDLLFTPSRFPIALTALAALACFSRDRACACAARWLVATALAWVALYFIDFNEASMERLHAPAALCVVLAAAAGLAALPALPSAWLRRAPPIAALAVALTALPTVPRLFARTNEDLEDAYLRAVRALLPHEPSLLVHVGWSDPGNGVHRHFPEYLFAARGDRFVDVRDWERAPNFMRPVFFLHEMRCYAQQRADDAPPPAGAPIDPSCALMRGHWRFETRLEQHVPNLGTEYFRWYPAASELTLALYRVLPP